MPQHHHKTVTVYNYWLEHGEDMHSDVSPEKAPLDVIVNELHSTPLLGTAQQVDAAALEHGKVYRRRATGWMGGAADAEHLTTH
ncbi:MAG: hypothetical protein IPJ08_09335 [Burkholderiales bacterium]|nr:hypothetical protein [Burkholderiales bacterium]MBP6676418.1 hypothetical protein [Vitreoscilla sp.]